MKLSYCGNELELFEFATNWKRYAAATVSGFISGKVLEVGAGLGGSSIFYYHDSVKTWTALEPDPVLFKKLIANTSVKAKFLNGTLQDLKNDDFFDTILYIDVLEHIKDDIDEIKEACKRLTPNGNLIVISPAHQFLYSPFDREVGHFRRYSEKGLNRICPNDFFIRESGYLDSAGFFLSLTNKVMLHKNMPSSQQIAFWDKYIVPISIRLDKLLFFRFGKTVYSVFKKVKNLDNG